MNAKKLIMMVVILTAINAYAQNYIVKQETEEPGLSGIEYPIENMEYDYSTKVMYSISANNTNLFVHIRIGDEELQRQWLRRGITVWIDTTGHRKQTMGFTYRGMKPQNKPLPNSGQDMQPATKPNHNNEVKEPSGLDSNGGLELIGINAKGDVVFVTDTNQYGISAQCHITDEKVLYYKGIIPLKYLGNPEKMSIGIVAMPNKPQEKQQMQNGQMRPEGQAGFSSKKPKSEMGPSGGGHGGNGRNMPPDNSPNTSLWIKNVVIFKSPKQ
jgi:hypothetical protein